MFRIKYSREIVLKILFQIDLLKMDGAPAEELAHYFLQHHARVTAGEKDYVLHQVGLVLQGKEELDSIISAHLIGWSRPPVHTAASAASSI